MSSQSTASTTVGRSVPPPARARSATASPAPSDAVVYTLALLIQRFGRAEPALVEAHVGAAEVSQSVSVGERISTARIVRDGVRILGTAGSFLATATEAQREELIMIDAPFLSAATTSLDVAETAQRRLDLKKNAASAVRNTAKTRGTSAEQKARRRRAALYEALLTATCGDGDWKKKLDHDMGAAPTAAEVADSIEKLVAHGRVLVPWAKERGASCPLNDAYFTKTLQIAESCRVLGAEGTAPASRDGINQGEVDRLDGRALWFLKRVIDTFDVAHEADPTIPKLPVYSLRAIFGRGTRRKPAPPVNPPQP